jgi:hypothetical protein
VAQRAAEQMVQSAARAKSEALGGRWALDADVCARARVCMCARVPCAGPARWGLGAPAGTRHRQLAGAARAARLRGWWGVCVSKLLATCN